MDRENALSPRISSMKQLPSIRAMIAALVLLVARPTAAAGEVTPPRIARPWIFRGEIHVGGTPLVNLIFTPPNQNSVSMLALTLGRNLTEAFSVEATLGTGVGDIYSPGAESMIVGRGALVLGRKRANALTIAAGPMFIAGGAYGPVAFGHAEVGYELRAAARWTILVALGPDLTLTSSRAQSTAGCGEGGIFGPAEPACVRPFTRGDLFVHFRTGVGFTF
jgi:hypothetical protein